MGTDYIPLPSNVVRGADVGEAADQPKLDDLIGETIVVRALEWIGDEQAPKGVRLAVHIVKGDTMTKAPAWYRGYTVSVMRVARQLAAGDKGRQVQLAQWPMYKVVRMKDSYGLADA